MNIGERIETGSAGVLAPGRWLWARAIGWMVLLFAVVVAVVAAGPLFDRLTGRPMHQLPLPLAVLSVVIAYLAYGAAVWFGERRRPSELALKALPLDLAAGLLVGLVVFSAVFMTLRLLGIYGTAPGHGLNWVRAITANMVTGLFEELVFRAIVFRLLLRAFGVWPALVLSAALFGGLHLLNPNSTPVAAIAIAIEAGLMLAAFYLLTGRLWMSIGVHAAWNFAQGSIFGARVSGLTPTSSLLISAPHPGAPVFISGGGFGPEASLPAIVIGGATFLIVLAYLMRRPQPRG